MRAGFVNNGMFLVNPSLGLYLKLLRPHRYLPLHVEHDGTMQEIQTSTLFVEADVANDNRS